MTIPQFDNQPNSEAVRPGGEAKALLNASAELAKVISAVASLVEKRKTEAAQALQRLQDALVEARLNQIDTNQLRDSIEGNIRLTAVADRYPTVGELARTSRARLEAINGVGAQTAAKVIEAVAKVRANVRAHTLVKLSLDDRSGPYSELVLATWHLNESHRIASTFLARYQPLVPRINSLVHTATPMMGRVRLFFRNPEARAEAHQAAAELANILANEVPDLGELREIKDGLLQLSPTTDEAWTAFAVNPIAFNELLVELGAVTPDANANQGYLPATIAERVEAHPLNTTLLKATLRGYQAFGARFALAQVRTILGDDMGLGKTIEALAVACHVTSAGEPHVLVVAPASVLVNWLHETAKHSHLPAHRLHGTHLQTNLATWATEGGLAVTTFGTLSTFEVPPEIQISLLVVDEAHFVKNPEAKRTQAVLTIGQRAKRVLYMTGTPMENRVSEFKSLISQLQPDVLANLETAGFLSGPEAFRPLVAPVYLRRNQADVLNELPERIDVPEWLEFGEIDAEAYRVAVASGNFMAMRQAAFAPATPEGSTKLARLLELVEQVSEQGRKVIVFSFFRSVLTSVANALGEVVIGPISGDVTPQRRQAMVDEFTNREAPAVLVAQVIAGGVGLNIQAASVVIMAEPQIKPAMEEQAIARSHRMGQTRIVYVHKLLTENSVDERMLEILAEKQRLFDEYAVGSTLKDATASAIDPTSVDVNHSNGMALQTDDAELNSTDAASVQEDELGITRQMEHEIIRMERQRLGLPDAEILEPT